MMTSMAYAQEKKYGINVGFQGNLPERIFNNQLGSFDGQRGGGGFSIGPSYQYSEKIQLSAMVGFNVIAEDATTDDIGTFNILSVVPTISHQVLDTKVTPFYSVGIGSFSVLNSETRFAPGLSTNVGVSFFDSSTLSLEYTKILSQIQVNENVINGFDNWYYVGIKLLFHIKLK